MIIHLTPTEILIISQSLKRVVEFADKSPNTAHAIGIDSRTRKALTQIIETITKEAKNEPRKPTSNIR